MMRCVTHHICMDESVVGTESGKVLPSRSNIRPLSIRRASLLRPNDRGKKNARRRPSTRRSNAPGFLMKKGFLSSPAPKKSQKKKKKVQAITKEAEGQENKDNDAFWKSSTQRQRKR